MSNINRVSAPYFGFLREMVRRAEEHAGDEHAYSDEDRTVTNYLYEIEALTNVVGEMECARAECERRIRYLQAKAGENV